MSRIRVTFLGTGNAFADGGRSNACILVQASGVALLLDCGGSALPMLKRHADPAAVDAVVVSHLHGDHFGGLPYLVIEQHYAGRKRPLAVAGPRALAERLTAADLALYPDFYGKPGQPAFAVEHHAFGGELALGAARVEALPVRHVPLSDPHGVRVRIGETLLAYSGDAIWSDELPRVAKGADLFICEATNFSLDDPSHISYRTLMAHRKELDCARIVVTHLGADTLAHLDEVELEHAEDGASLTI